MTLRGSEWPTQVDPVEADAISVSRIKSSHPLHEPRQLSVAQRERFRNIAKRSRTQALLAASGDLDALHEPNRPNLDIDTLIPQLWQNELRSLSLFSGGGGLDLGFDRAGYTHVASYELLEHAAATLRRNRPEWEVFGGDDDGDVTGVKWSRWKGQVDVLHGGPPCQPFSNAGRQRGALDPRDCWPATVKAIKAVQPAAFVAENVPALAGKKFTEYVHEAIDAPLTQGRQKWHLAKFFLEAKDFGVPQVRRRFIIVGFRSKAAHARFVPPSPTHWWGSPVEGLAPTMGVRHALGLPQLDEHPDGLAPTIRSGLTGPRFTTSVCNSTSAAKSWASLGLWPNGVAVTREAASAFPTDTGAFRLSVEDVALIQGFPCSWTWPHTVYKAVGQIGNAVAPPVAYAVARAVTDALGAAQAGGSSKIAASTAR